MGSVIGQTCYWMKIPNLVARSADALTLAIKFWITDDVRHTIPNPNGRHPVGGLCHRWSI